MVSKGKVNWCFSLNSPGESYKNTIVPDNKLVKHNSPDSLSKQIFTPLFVIVSIPYIKPPVPWKVINYKKA